MTSPQAQSIANPLLMMSKHGKSFHFASQVFSPPVFQRICYLYAFCRFVNDTADEQAPAQALIDLENLKLCFETSGETKNFLRAAPDSREIKVQDLITELISFGIKREYLEVLVDGALFDVTSQKIETTKDLLRYCYHVAGVVGLMMCPLILVKDKKAYPFAIDLGIGMQITNICRDILEDAKNERTYLPSKILKIKSLDLAHLQTEGEAPSSLKDIIKEHLDLADQYYESSFQGLAYIPFRPRLAILLASEIYRAIGLKLRAKNFEALKGRVYLSRTEKILVSLKALAKILRPRFWTPGVHDSKLHSPLQGLPEVALLP